MRQVLCPVLIGREREVQALHEGLDRMGGALFVAGEAGVGKSRLVRELCHEAGTRGLPVLTGRAVAGGVPVAYRPLAEAVLGGLRGREELDLPEVRPYRSALGRLVPQWLAPEPVPGAESPVVLGEGLLRLLRDLGGGRGCVLVLEDLHWADRESLAVLEYLADNVAGERILCVGTLRAEEPGPGREVIRTLVGRRAARMLPLTRLDGDQTVRLARACLDAVTLPTVVEEFLKSSTDGLPFLVEELLAGLVGAGVLVEEDGRWSVTGPIGGLVPPGFADGVRRRLAAGHGARVTGLDAAAPMLTVARERLPHADLRVGDIQDLPFGDDAFDVVTAFNVLQYAAAPAAAVAELARVTRPGGRVAIGVWGEPAQCETETLFQRIRALTPPLPGEGTPLALSTPGVVEELLAAAGLVAAASAEVPCPFHYPDLATGWRGQSSIGPLRRAIDIAGEDVVRAVFDEVQWQHRQPDGSYRQDNVLRYVIAGRLRSA